MKKKSQIYIKFQQEGIHCYPDAAINPLLKTGDEYDVSFLASKHRHLFYFKVYISVTHQDRDIEFFQFQRWCKNLYSEKVIDLNNKSCEMICDDLYEEISKKYPNREVTIDVSEDDENGAVVTYPVIVYPV